MKIWTILDLVFDGDCYADKVKINENKEYQKYSQEVHDKVEKLCENMTEEEKNSFMWDFTLALGGIEASTSEEYFKEGFRLGLILGAQNFLE